MEHVALTALVVIAALAVSLISLACLRSMNAYSTKVLELALSRLDPKKEAERDRLMALLAEKVERLDQRVYDLFTTARGPNNRTIIQRPIATGETPPVRMAQPELQGPLPPEGLDDEPTAPRPSAAKERERVLGAAT